MDSFYLLYLFLTWFIYHLHRYHLTYQHTQIKSEVFTDRLFTFFFKPHIFFSKHWLSTDMRYVCPSLLCLLVFLTPFHFSKLWPVMCCVCRGMERKWRQSERNQKRHIKNMLAVSFKPLRKTLNSQMGSFWPQECWMLLRNHISTPSAGD